MKTLGLISCTKKKQSYRCKASEMYSASDLFRKAFSFAVEHYDLAAILSAKYGLLLPSDIIEPYNMTLNDLSPAEVAEWANRVLEQMNDKLSLSSFNKAYFHAGERYRQSLIPKLENIGIRCEVPLRGLRIGEQLSWYANVL